MIRFDASRHSIFVSLIALVLSIGSCFLAFHQGAIVHAAGRAAHSSARTANSATHPTQSTSATPVLVELFTSEGCSSCPPADALLARLQRSQPIPAVDILTLEEHVDYWDSLGWHDRFSSQQFSARQTAYIDRLRLSSEYTPQMIVDGTDQFSGNDVIHALRAIAHAAGEPKLALSLSPLAVDGERIAGTVHVARPVAGRRKSAPAHGADVYVAVVQSVASTHVISGENNGQTLQHVSVVREMQRIGSLAQATTARLKFSLSAPKDTSSVDLRVVVFIQRAGQGAILGAISSPPIPAPAPQISAAAPPTRFGN